MNSCTRCLNGRPMITGSECEYGGPGDILLFLDLLELLCTEYIHYKTGDYPVMDDFFKAKYCPFYTEE